MQISDSKSSRIHNQEVKAPVREGEIEEVGR